EPVKLPTGLAVVICDSAKPRRLVDSAYNQRRTECMQAARLLGLLSLRDATPDMLGAADLPDVLARRARHIIEENARVRTTARALRAGDAVEVGRQMYASHASLRDLFEVSCPELDALVEIAGQLPGCFGARLTGAGFGGCTVNLVDAGIAEAFQAELLARYRERTGLRGWTAICQAAGGVTVVRVSSGL
ncbi:MAG: galactokinase, partial [Chloroflexota bacterium]|nr:galactokinase [Chloroflexota bacterium]